MDNEERITMLREMPIPQLLMKMGLPTMIGMLVTGLYSIVDACFVGGANPYIGCERWLKKAAEQNYIYAEELLADKYYEGVYIVKDVKAAIYWYEKAANQGSVYAMYRAGYIYYSEPIDYNKAGQWFSLAAEKGDKDAEEVLRNNLRYNRFTKKWDAVR